MDRERKFEASPDALRDSAASRRDSETTGQPVTDEEFVPPETTAQDLGDTVGNVSEAERLLRGEAGTEQSEAPLEGEGDAIEAGEDPAFTAPKRVLLDLDLEGTTGKSVVREAATPERERVRENILAEIRSAVQSWKKYDSIEGLRTARSIEHFSRFNRDFDGLVEKLTDIKVDMLEFGKTQEGMMPDGTNIGETLHPVLMPWEFFAYHVRRGTLPDALKLIREKQGIEEHILDYPFMIGSEHLKDRKDRTYGDDASLKYLWNKINKQGWWGIFLVQSQQPYIPSPTEDLLPQIDIKEEQNYRNDTVHRLAVHERTCNGYTVDNLGIYEWLALSLQEKPESFKDSATVLPANINLYDEGRDLIASVGYGAWDEKRKRVIQNWVPTEEVDTKDYAYRIAINPLLAKKEEKKEPED